MRDGQDALLRCLGSCVDVLRVHGDEVSDAQWDEIGVIYTRLLGVQDAVIRGGSVVRVVGSSDISKSVNVTVIEGLSSKLSLAVRAVFDSRFSRGDRGDRGFCLSCHLYTRGLSVDELKDLLGYFVNNGFPGSVITDPNEYGKRFIFLRSTGFVDADDLNKISER